MSLVNFTAREITCKIVYYGQGRSGKTTNLQYVYGRVPEARRGRMVSLATQTDRTLFFDFLPLDLGEIGWWRIALGVVVWAALAWAFALTVFSRKLGLTTIQHNHNLGYGGNQKTCYTAALERGADIVVMVHPDYQYSPRLCGAMASSSSLMLLAPVARTSRASSVS